MHHLLLWIKQMKFENEYPHFFFFYKNDPLKWMRIKHFIFSLLWVDILFIKLIIWQTDRYGRPDQMFSALFQASCFAMWRRSLHTYRENALHDNCTSFEEQEAMGCNAFQLVRKKNPMEFSEWCWDIMK